jgi:hypothetical protein
MKPAILLSLILILTGCTALQPALPPVNPKPDAVPDEQPVESPTQQEGSLPDLTPTSALLATLMESNPETAPDQTTETAEGQPLTIPDISEIAILRPGQLSRHTSPIRVLASFSNEADSRTIITLYGEDSRVLAQRNFDILPYQDPVNGNVILDLDFTIQGLAETGKLEFKVFDAYGRLRALNSVYLILLSRGITDRNYAPEDGERIDLQIPFPDQTEIEGSTLFLAGLVRLTQPPEEDNPKPLTVQLVAENGDVVGDGQASVVLSPGSAVGQFVAEIPYQVTAPTRVLLTIAIEEGRLPGFAYLRTFELTLLP